MKTLVKKHYEAFLQSRRFKTVAEHLNAEGYQTKNGTMLTGQSVSRVLRDKVHLESGAISQELWDEVQVILASQDRGNKAKRRVKHLCSGILKCGCGRTMYVPTNSKKYTCQKCRNKIIKDDLETIVLKNLKLSENEKIAEMVHNWKSLSFSQQREIIESTVQKIVAEDKKVTLTLFAFG